MRRLLLFGAFLLSHICCIYGQEAQPTPVDSSATIPTVSEITQTVNVPVTRYGTDELINRSFGKFGDPVSGAIFYAPSYGEDVIIREVGNLRSTEDFFETPPFTLSYTTGNAPSYGKVFTLQHGEDGQLVLTYPEEDTVLFGQAVSVNGQEIVFDKKGFDEKNDQFVVEGTTVGSQQIFEGISYTTPDVYDGDPADTVGSIILAYTARQVVPENGLVEAEDFTFTLNRQASSAYNFENGSAYSFQINEVKFLPIVVIVLILGATFFTLYFGFVNIRKFGLAINVVRGAYSDPNEKGEVSHFQALTAALSGTVGLGNIAGVAIAISIGGAGATFWMIMAGLLGMSSKFTECTLGVKYRTIDPKGEVSGGPMYYLSRGLAEMGLGGLGKVFAAFFAVMCIGGSFGGGNMFQVNQAYKQFVGVFEVDMAGWLFGLIMAILVAIVIIGGIKSIASVTDKIVPIMVGVYVTAALVILGINFGEIPRAFGEIISGAFAPTAVAGGFIGVLIQGFRRAAFSNEAGVGSASIAHAAVKTNNPASEGIVALLEPFIDTVVVCTMTALVIIITNNHLDPNAADGVALTSQAFSSEIPFFNYVLVVAVILFAFSTMITWSYYGLKAWTYLFGGSRAADITYKVLFCTFVVIGAAASLGKITDFSDAMIFAMAFPNIIGVAILAPKVRDELRDYLGKIKSGEIIKVK